jgi:hypothetical protein
MKKTEGYLAASGFLQQTTDWELFYTAQEFFAILSSEATKMRSELLK